ncbi:MAG: lysophospholipid acyltransferase family protein [Synergistaceae bacterium]|nr:lysophospholipid acyltransferase family protein [Synergistaceae bacterium]
MNNDRSWRLVDGLRRLLRALPYRWSVKTGALLGRVLWFASRGKVDEAERRCVRALQVGVTEARRIVRASYANLGRSVAEFISMDGRKAGRFVEFRGEEYLKEALARGRGVVLISAHLGNWELGAAAVAAKGYPMNAIGTDQRDDRITDLIIQSRAGSGVTTVGKGFDLKAAIRCLKKGEALAILIDQDVRDKGVIIPFLGLPASTPYGPVKMAARLKSTLLPVFMIRRGSSVYHDLHFLPSPWEKGYPEEDESMEEAMTRLNDEISRFIRRYPGQWMWLYPRWASVEKAGNVSGD